MPTQLTKDQVRDIILKRPANVMPEDVINELTKRGYQLEGYNPLIAGQPVAPVVPPAGGQPGAPTPDQTQEPQGAKGFKGFFSGVFKGIGNTIQGLSEPGQKFLDATVGHLVDAAMGKDHAKVQAQQDAVDKTISDKLTPHGGAEKIGFGAEQIGEFFIPAGEVEKAIKLGEEGIKGLDLASKYKYGGALEKAMHIGMKAVIRGSADAAVAQAQQGKTISPEAAFATGGLFSTGADLIKGGAKALRSIVTDIPENVKTELGKTTMQKFDQYMGVAKEAVKDSSKATPLEFAGTKAQSALDTLKSKLTTLGKAKDAVLEKLGGKKITGAQDVLNTFYTDLEKKLGASIEAGSEKVVNAKGTVTKIAADSGSSKLVQDVHKLISGLPKDLTLKHIDGLVDALQNTAYSASSNLAAPADDATTSLVKSFAGKLNKLAREAGGETYREANKSYSTIRGTFDDLNAALGKEGDKGASILKQAFSPAGTKAKRIFSEVKNLTGIDLVHEGVLAKFSMDAAGDTRQLSLLQSLGEGLPSTKEGWIKWLINKGFKDPEGLAKQIVSQAAKK